MRIIRFKKNIAIIMAIFLLLCLASITARASASKTDTAKKYDEIVFATVRELNKQRKKNDKTSFKISPKLQKIADIRGDELLETFSHTRPDGNGFYSVFVEIGYGENELFAAENIAAGRETAEEVVRMWMKSAGHKKNILTSDFTHVGLCRVHDEDSKYGYYWVLVLADLSK